MKKKVRVSVFSIILLTVMLLNAYAEKNLSAITPIQLDEKMLEEIRQQAELPRDYDMNRAMEGMDYLIMVEGFSAPGAAGLTGNGYVESRLLLNAGKGFYKGLFQWDGNCRWPKVKKYLETNEVNFDNQEELYLWELIAAVNSENAQNYEEVIEYCKHCESADESAEKWCKKFEGTKHALSMRKRLARLTLNAYRLYIKLNRNGIKYYQTNFDEDDNVHEFVTNVKVETM